MYIPRFNVVDRVGNMIAKRVSHKRAVEMLGGALGSLWLRVEECPMPRFYIQRMGGLWILHDRATGSFSAHVSLAKAIRKMDRIVQREAGGER